MKKYLKYLLPVIAPLIIILIPAPEKLSANAWHYFAIFIGVVLALILEPVPAALSGLIGVVLAASFQLVPLQPDKPITAATSVNWALSGFSDSVVWLIFVAFMFAMGYDKTGLGKRISLLMVKSLGKRSLGLGYAMAFSDLILAPFMPSNTARSAGTIYPIIKNIPVLYGSTPDKDPRKLGAYMMWVGISVTCVTSSMFYTALAPNILALNMVKDIAKQNITWGQWFLNFAPVGILLILIIPYLTYIIYPPEIKVSPEVPEWAAGQLKDLGKMKKEEKYMGLLAILALFLWIFGEKQIHSTIAAMIVLSLMVLLKVVDWNDIIGNKQAWNVLFWFGTLVTLAGGLKNVGFLKWFADISASMVAGYGVMTIMIILVALFFISHYFFASITAHVTALLPIFLTTAMAIPGMNMLEYSMLLCASLGIMGVITPYATGPSPIWYGSGYISQKAFWALGAVFGLIFIAALLVIGVPWIGFIN